MPQHIFVKRGAQTGINGGNISQNFTLGVNPRTSKMTRHKKPKQRRSFSTGTFQHYLVPLPNKHNPKKQSIVTMSSGFGQWYEEKKAAENGDSGNSSSSWFNSEEVLPLFNVGDMSNVEMPTFSGMKASLEAQLPQNVMGMNYQQRFQVSSKTCSNDP